MAETIDDDLQHIESETELKAYLADILEGLVYLHYIGVIHADLKLENILAHKEPEMALPTLKICDFGLSQLADENGEVILKEKIGTMHYIAPEVKAGNKVSFKIDMWSLGICLYKMCCAYRPNQVKDYTYGSGPIPFRQIDWDHRTPELVDIITQMLQYDPAKRISSEDALNHPWLQV